MFHQYSVSTVCEKIKNEGKKTKITPRLEADTGLCHCLVLHVCHIHVIMGPEGPVPRENCKHSSTLSTYYSAPTGFHDFFFIMHLFLNALHYFNRVRLFSVYI